MTIEVETDEVSLQDEIRAAMQESAESQIDPVEKPVIEDTGRDERGRFASKDKTEAEPAPAEVTPPESQNAEVKVPSSEEAPGNWNQDKAPQSWTPQARERWSEIPEDLRKEIIRREEAAVAGFRKMNEQMEPVRRVAEGLSPFLQEASQFGVEPVGYIANVMQTERVLRTADTKTKFQVLMDLADQYGVPLREVINESVGEKVFQSPQQQQAAIPPEVARQLQEMQTWRQQQEQQAYQREVESFAASNEFFNDVRNDMAILLEGGRAKDLKDAYEQAIWMNPDVRSVLLSRRGQEEQQGREQSRRQVAATASLPAPGRVDVKVGDDSDDIYSAVRSSIAELGRG